MPPCFAGRIASKTTKVFGSLTLPFLVLCVSWTVTILAPVASTSLTKLSALPDTIPAALVEKIFIFLLIVFILLLSFIAQILKVL